MSEERIETSRLVRANPSEVFDLLCDPDGHVAVDATGMLQSADGAVVTAAGDSFVVHMDREALGDLPDYGEYDVTVTIEDFERDRLLSWSILGRVRPPIGHLYGYRLEPADGGTQVTSFYDWSGARQDLKDAGMFPVVSELALRATLGILDRTVRRGWVRPAG